MSRDLEEIIETVEAMLEDAERGAGTYADDPASWHRRHRGLMFGVSDSLVAQFGARVTERFDGTKVSLGGVAASSTTGLAGALRNWLVRARSALAVRGELS